MTTILVVDDQPAVLNALKQCFAMEPDLQIIGTAEDGAQALALVRDLRPDILLTDIKMPLMNGIVATRAVLQASPDTKVVILSVYDDPLTRSQALAAGAAAFVAKHDPADLLIAEIRRVAASLS
jgi:DNA-binding NarL/FixJ family response regulator